MTSKRSFPWRGCRALAAGVLLAAASSQALPRLSSELREAMHDFAAGLATLLEASTRQPLAASAAQRGAVDGALAKIEEHAGLMVQHLERDDVAFMASALERQAQLLRFSARSGNASAFNLALDRSIGTCVDCHARTSEDRGTRLAARLLPPDIEAKLPPLRRARLQVATRRFEAARETLETAMETLQGPSLRDAVADYLSLSLRILPDPARALARLQAIDDARGDRKGALGSWRASLEHWVAHPGTLAELSRAREALSRGRAQADPEHARVDVLVAVNEAERWLDRGLGSDAEAAEAYLILGDGEQALMPSTWLPLPELYLEQAVRLAPGSATARDAVTVLGRVLEQRFAAGGMPIEVSDHLRALQRMAGQPGS